MFSEPDWMERAWLRRRDNKLARVLWAVTIGLALCAQAANIFWNASEWVGALGFAVTTLTVLTVLDVRRRERQSAERD